MSDLIRPAGGRPGTVILPSGGASQLNQPLPGIGQRQASPYGTMGVVDPLAGLRQMVEQGGGGAGTPGGGNIRWEQYGDSRYEDQAQRDLRNESNADNDLNQIYVTKFAAAAVEFAQFICARRGTYYEEFRMILENFRLNMKMQTPCAIRGQFVDTINRHPEMVQAIARAAIPMYGQRLVTIAKMKPTGEVDRKEYIGAIHFAIRCVLTMELIGWLCKTPQGRQCAFNLTPEIKQIIANLENYKDIFSAACANFGVTNPYAGLVYDVQLPTRTDVHLISEAETAYMYNDFNHRPEAERPTQGIAEDNDLMKMIRRNAEKSRRSRGAGAVYHRHEEDHQSWNKVRNDFQNLTPENKDEFELHKFFHNIGKHNHYVISESDWKKIKHVFNRHPDQPAQEETVLRGCFRIVIIDLLADSGWFSTVVRGEGLDMRMVLTNPEKLLPLLEGDSESGMVTPVAAETALGKKSKSLEIPVETCVKLEGIPVVTLKEEIATNSSKKLIATITTTNDQLTKNFKQTNATSFNTVIWDTFTCDDAGDKRRLFDDLPFLFKDGVEEGKPRSFHEKIHAIAGYFDEGILGEELMEFISDRLTDLTKEWFVSSLGYDKNPNSPDHLSITNIIEDYSDLNEILAEDNEDGYRLFNAPSDINNYLTEQMKLFTFEAKYDSVSGSGIIQATQKQLELLLERPLHITVINKRQSLIADQSGEPLVIKRSVFPEYFDLVEKGFEPTMGAGKSISVTDKLLQFTADEHLWLFSYSATDRNVATLRRVTRRQSLLFMSLA